MEALPILNGILLIFALTTDSFVVSFAYGMEKTEMPLSRIVVMNLIMSSLLALALFFGNVLASVFPAQVTSWLGTLLLFLMGGYRLGAFFLKKQGEAQEVKALTAQEGVVLAFALSADSLAAGLGTGLVQSGEFALAAGFFFVGILMMKAGWLIGNKCRQASGKDLSWLGGICLLLLALSTAWK